jgi:hypothetical protein
MTKIFLLAAIILTGCFPAAAQSEPAKKTETLRVEEVVARHIASIGTPEDIAAAKTHVFVGDAVKLDAASYGNPAKGRVPVQFATDGKRLLLAMVFGKSGDENEMAAFDGEDQSLNFPKNSSLGDYLKLKSLITENGFLGGAFRLPGR